MITSFFAGVVVAIPTSLVVMKLFNSSLFIDNEHLKEANVKLSLITVSYTHLTLPTNREV